MYVVNLKNHTWGSRATIGASETITLEDFKAQLLADLLSHTFTF
jgi:hypothetical protein